MSNLTEADVKDRLDRWFGLRHASYPQPMLDAVVAIVNLPADDRVRAAGALKAFFCTSCGDARTDPSIHGICQCENDE